MYWVKCSRVKLLDCAIGLRSILWARSYHSEQTVALTFGSLDPCTSQRAEVLLRVYFKLQNFSWWIDFRLCRVFLVCLLL